MHRCMSINDNLYANFTACWQRASRKKKALLYVGVYTIVFLIAFLIAFSPFLLDGKTFVWQVDGRDQHLPYLVYIGKALRRIVVNLMDGKLAVPLFDLSLGGGGRDILAFFSSQGRTDPLFILSALVPTRYSEYLYDFLAIFRLYLAGLSFSFLCFYFRKRAMHTLIGSFVYCFSGYAIFAMRHPFFVNPMISLPLLTVGIDKILKKEKPYLFVFAMFYAALCGYYHLYMMTIMLAIYGVVRFFDVYKENRFKKFLTFVGGGVSGYLLGIGLAAIFFLPAIDEFLHSVRAGFSNVYIAYTWWYCLSSLMRLIAPPGSQSYMAFAAIVLFALTLLFFTKGNRALKIFTVTAFVFLLTSTGGLIMNGFQYPTDRWTFGLVLVAAYVVVEMLPQLLNLTRKLQMECLIALVFYTAACFAAESIREIKYVSVGCVFLSLTLLVLTMSLKAAEEHAKFEEKRNGEKANNWLRGCLCLLLVVANVGVNGIYRFSLAQGQTARYFQKIGYEINLLENTVERELEPYLLKAPKGRGDGTEFSRKTGLVWQIPGLLFFSATTPKCTTEFMEAIELCGQRFNFELYSSDQRTISNTLLSMRYQVEPLKKTCYVPFGYKQIGKTEKGNLIFENKYALPWGYTYDHAISYEELTGLNGVEKQEAMLQAIALDEETRETKLNNALQFEEKRLPFKVVCSGCTWKDGKLIVSRANASITLRFSMPKNVEGYVRLKGFNINDSDLAVFEFKMQCEDIVKTSWATSHFDKWYSGRENYLFSFGYSEHERKRLTIAFPRKGTFKLKDIELLALPMDDYPARIEALHAEPMNNIKWDVNSLKGTVDLSKDKILCVSVPYSKGWFATVDGKRAKILRGNYMFMALPLKAGHHEIKFSYCTPGLKLGAMISALCACIVAGMLLRDRHRRKVQ